MSTVPPELEDLARQFAAAREDASKLVSGLHEPEFNWRAAPGHWSIAECLLHLNIVGDRCVHVFDAALPDTRPRHGEGSPAHGWLGKWILAQTEPPPRRKFTAPRSFTPPEGQPLTAVMPTFFHLQNQLTLRLYQAAGRDLASVKVHIPGTGPFRFNLLLVLAWLAAHQRRHLWQAWQVRRHPGFPVRD